MRLPSDLYVVIPGQNHLPIKPLRIDRRTSTPSYFFFRDDISQGIPCGCICFYWYHNHLAFCPAAFRLLFDKVETANIRFVCKIESWYNHWIYVCSILPHAKKRTLKRSGAGFLVPLLFVAIFSFPSAFLFLLL